MKAHGSTLASNAFGSHADPPAVVACRSQQDALDFVRAALCRPEGIVTVQGPAGSGKTTLLRSLSETCPPASAFARVDGIHLTPRHLLTGALAQFEVRAVGQDDQALMQALSNFLSQETRERRVPIVAIDNADRASASALRLLNWLAALESGGKYVLRIVLTGSERMAELVQSETLRNLARRRPATWSLNPLSVHEAMLYLRTRLVAAGGRRADKVFPQDVCERLHATSRGWPGALNAAALETLARAGELASTRRVPLAVLTKGGETLADYELTDRRYIIGRSELADIVVADGYVSKVHAMLQVYRNALVLIDLNSTNGTTVNSREVARTLLKSDDVIMLGRHRLKIEQAPEVSPELAEGMDTTDTVRMQTLTDLRRARARRNMAALKGGKASPT